MDKLELLYTRVNGNKDAGIRVISCISIIEYEIMQQMIKNEKTPQNDFELDITKLYQLMKAAGINDFGHYGIHDFNITTTVTEPGNYDYEHSSLNKVTISFESEYDEKLFCEGIFTLKTEIFDGMCILAKVYENVCTMCGSGNAIDQDMLEVSIEYALHICSTYDKKFSSIMKAAINE